MKKLWNGLVIMVAAWVISKLTSTSNRQEEDEQPGVCDRCIDAERGVYGAQHCGHCPCCK